MKWRHIKSAFKLGPESWHSYDYHGSLVAGGANRFVLATHEKDDGFDDKPYVWVDHTRWSADTPEEPISILALLRYQCWLDEPSLDLRNATMGCILRGDELELHGAKVYFWIVTDKGLTTETRWHFHAEPLSLSRDEWNMVQTPIQLVPDESMWYVSWSLANEECAEAPGGRPGPWPAKPQPLAHALANVDSYGFSFVGFKKTPTGRLSLGFFNMAIPDNSGKGAAAAGAASSTSKEGPPPSKKAKA